MALVSSTLLDPGGEPIEGASLEFRLRASTPVGFDPTNDNTIAFVTAITTDANGDWDVDVTGNDAISPAGSYYTLTIRSPHDGEVLEEIAFQVTAAGGPFDLYDVVVDLPSDQPVVSGLWTPTASFAAGGGTINATWEARWDLQPSRCVHLSIHGVCSGTWSGGDVLELSLPAWYNPVDTFEQYLTGLFIPRPPTFGLHAPLVGVIHPADDPDQSVPPKLRIVVPDVDGTTTPGWWLPFEGANYPGAMSADDTIDLSGTVLYV